MYCCLGMSTYGTLTSVRYGQRYLGHSTYFRDNLLSGKYAPFFSEDLVSDFPMKHGGNIEMEKKYKKYC
jgi:hypothetical protein